MLFPVSEHPPRGRKELQATVCFVLVRLFWLSRARVAMQHVVPERRKTECWLLDFQLAELQGDARYALACFPGPTIEVPRASPHERAARISKLP